VSARDSGRAASVAEATRAAQRIAFVGDSASVLAARYGRLATGLRSARHGVAWVTPVVDLAGARLLAAVGGAVVAVPARKPPSQWFPLAAQTRGLKHGLAAFAPHVVSIDGAALLAPAMAAVRTLGPTRLVAVLDDVPAGLGRLVARLDAVVLPTVAHEKAARAAGQLPDTVPCAIVPGAGIDLDRVPAVPLPPLTDGLVLTMVAGATTAPAAIADYVAAAARVKARAPNVRFQIMGRIPADVSPDVAAAVERLGAGTEAPAAFAACHVAVHASRGEGVPAPLLAALATGRPVVTSDVAGCREAVDERVNGCLAPAGDVGALAAVIEGLLKRPDLLPHMARASRAKAERRYDTRAVEAMLAAVLGLGRIG
jgi:hypothetical protein